MTDARNGRLVDLYGGRQWRCRQHVWSHASVQRRRRGRRRRLVNVAQRRHRAAVITRSTTAKSGAVAVVLSSRRSLLQLLLLLRLPDHRVTAAAGRLLVVLGWPGALPPRRVLPAVLVERLRRRVSQLGYWRRQRLLPLSPPLQQFITKPRDAKSQWAICRRRLFYALHSVPPSLSLSLSLSVSVCPAQARKKVVQSSNVANVQLEWHWVESQGRWCCKKMLLLNKRQVTSSHAEYGGAPT